jgi:hypothetical protein
MHLKIHRCMSTKTFTCRHCHRCLKKNPRIKSGQHYCGSKICQQARKNQWERDRLGSDPAYRAYRSLAKKKWYQGYPGDRYQHAYRQAHPDYVSGNREKQGERGKRHEGKASGAKIVKTDTLSSDNLVPRGFYVLSPYEKTNGKKVVKTDALIVELRACGGFSRMVPSYSG